MKQPVDLDWLEQEIVKAVNYKYPDARDREKRIVAVVEALSEVAEKYGSTIVGLVAICDIRQIHDKLKTVQAEADGALPTERIQ